MPILQKAWFLHITASVNGIVILSSEQDKMSVPQNKTIKPILL